MANPQKEDGYVPIANSLMEALYKSDFSMNEYKILLCIIRFSYGFNKKSCNLSLLNIEHHTGIARPNISRTLKKLYECHVITIIPAHGVTPQRLSIQKNFEEWKGYHGDNRYHNDNGRVISSDNGRVISSDNPYKDNTTNKTKDNIYIVHPPSWFEEAWQAYPNKKGKNKIAKKCYAELEAAGKEKLLKCIENIKEYKEKNEWYIYQNGSTFFNGGWRDFDYDNSQENKAADPPREEGKKWQ